MKQVFKIVREYPENIQLMMREFIVLDKNGTGKTLTIFDDAKEGSGEWFAAFDNGPGGNYYQLVKDESSENTEHYLITDEENYYSLDILPGEVIIDEIPAPEDAALRA